MSVQRGDNDETRVKSVKGVCGCRIREVRPMPSSPADESLPANVMIVTSAFLYIKSQV